MWDLGAQEGSAKAPARNNALGGSTARATRAWRAKKGEKGQQLQGKIVS